MPETTTNVDTTTTYYSSADVDDAETALAPQQLRFVQEYIVDLNATQAYLRAGYHCNSLDSAKADASRLLANANVALAIARRQAAIDARLGLSAERTRRENGWIAHSSILDVITVQDGDVRIKDSADWTQAAAAAVQSVTRTEFKGKITISLKMHDKGAALERQGKTQNLYRDHEKAKGEGMADEFLGAMLAADTKFQELRAGASSPSSSSDQRDIIEGAVVAQLAAPGTDGAAEG